MNYTPFIEILFDAEKIKKDISWTLRWIEAEKLFGHKVVDSDENFRQQLQEFFFNQGDFDFQEYWTGRKYFAQLSDSVGMEPGSDVNDIDKVFETKGKNFDRMKAVNDRLKALEDKIFLKNNDLRDAAMAGKSASSFKPTPIERRNVKKDAS